MTKRADDKQFAEQAKHVFDESVERLDASTLSRLSQSRQAALAELEQPRSARNWLRWAPATGVAVAAVLTVMLMQGPMTSPEIEVPSTATDFEILMDEDSIEMFEDLEFYALMDGLEENGNVG